MKKSILITIAIAVTGGNLFAGYPVTDASAIANSKTQHTATIAKWVDNIAQLKTQINQLKEQIDIQEDLRKWAGDPVQAAKSLVTDTLQLDDLTRVYGEARDVVTQSTESLAALKNEAKGIYRAIDMRDIEGKLVQSSAEHYRRYSVLQARHDNARSVSDETRKRVRTLQEDIAKTTESLRTASTDAEVQKHAAKLTVLNGQLAQIETERAREVDEVVLQKIANDTQSEVEQAAELEAQAKNEHIANKRMSDAMNALVPPSKR